MLIFGKVGMDGLVGPIGVAQASTYVINNSSTVALAMVQIATLGAIISANVGMINLIPLPALDGGHIFFEILEGVFKIKIKETTMIRLQNFVMIFFMILGVVIIFNDILRIIGG